MLATQAPPPLSGHHLSRLGRRPLQPKNPSTITTIKPAECVQISCLDCSNKENIPHLYLIQKETIQRGESIDASLVDELNAIREKLERLRIEKDNNEKVLRERGVMLDLEMKEIANRGEVQKQLEMEVDRLYRLKEIKLACMRISRIRSLRDKEQEKKMKHDR